MSGEVVGLAGGQSALRLKLLTCVIDRANGKRPCSKTTRRSVGEPHRYPPVRNLWGEERGDREALHATAADR